MLKFPQSIVNRRGETLVEVLVALVILIISAVYVVRLFSVASINSELARERVIATNLAREGIEAVRVIRDTNWLRYAGERRICWNNNDPDYCSDSDGDQVADTPLADQTTYIAELRTADYRWELKEVTASLDLDDGVSGSESEYQLSFDATTGLYVHDDTGDTSPYYRQIYIEYLDDTGTSLTTTSPAEKANVMRVTSRVEWVDRGKHSNVTLTTNLTDYLGRNNHN
jgi:type II secretory pathway pseudopilin PulG